MRKIIIDSVVCFLILILTLGFPPLVLAHGDEPRLEISLERINPGGVLEVRGVGFEPEESIILALLGSGVEISVAELTADMEGVFQHVVALPGDLAEGQYNFRAVTDDHQVLSATLFVQGAAIVNEEGGQGQRAEDDGLLAPMPTYGPGVSSTAAAQTTAMEISAAQQGSNTLVYIVLIGIGIMALAGIGLLRKKLSSI